MTKEEKAAEQERQRILNAYRIFAQSADGQLVLEDMKRTYNFYSSSFNPNMPDDRLTAFREGQRSVVLDILGVLEHLDKEK
jgi:hypothetical protein